jgi:tetratricopeptide (TPR) repeat protein
MAAFARDVQKAAELLATNQFEEAQLTCRRALNAARSDPAVGTEARAEAYGIMLEAAVRMADFTLGNMVAKEILKSEQEAFGKDSLARAPGLYQVAGWYRRTNQLARERDTLAVAISIIERARGPRDSGLAYPLRATAASYLAQRKEPRKSRELLLRAAALEFGELPEDLLDRAELLASLGDHEVVFGDPEASGRFYSQAWKLIADDPKVGVEAANRYFENPVPVYVQIPTAPVRGSIASSEYIVKDEYFALGNITLGFSVTPHGLVEGLHVTDEGFELGLIPSPTLKAFQKARYRPRIRDGQPVLTEGQEFRMTFDLAGSR